MVEQREKLQELFSIQDRRVALIYVMSHLLGRDFPYDQSGLQQAGEEAWARSCSLMPPYDREQLTIHIKEGRKGKAIGYLLERAEDAISQENYGEMLKISNLIFAYGQLDYMSKLGGKMIKVSLRLHQRILHKFLHETSDLRSFYFAQSLEINREKNPTKKMVRRIGLTRTVIHLTAFNGHLGEEAKQFVDPFAIVPLQG